MIGNLHQANIIREQQLRDEKARRDAERVAALNAEHKDYALSDEDKAALVMQYCFRAKFGGPTPQAVTFTGESVEDIKNQVRRAVQYYGPMDEQSAEFIPCEEAK